jgi:hypothetical protein
MTNAIKVLLQMTSVSLQSVPTLNNRSKIRQALVINIQKVFLKQIKNTLATQGW